MYIMCIYIYNTQFVGNLLGPPFLQKTIYVSGNGVPHKLSNGDIEIAIVKDYTSFIGKQYWAMGQNLLTTLTSRKLVAGVYGASSAEIWYINVLTLTYPFYSDIRMLQNDLTPGPKIYAKPKKTNGDCDAHPHIYFVSSKWHHLDQGHDCTAMSLAGAPSNVTEVDMGLSEKRVS